MLSDEQKTELRSAFLTLSGKSGADHSIEDLALVALDGSQEFANQLDEFSKQLQVEAMERTVHGRISHNLSYYAGQIMGIARLMRAKHGRRLAIRGRHRRPAG